MSDDNQNEIHVKKPETQIVVTVYNRQQARKCAKLGIAFNRIKQTPLVNEKKREFKEFRNELAVKWGSTTGKLKKKHIGRQKEFDKINGEQNE